MNAKLVKLIRRYTSRFELNYKVFKKDTKGLDEKQLKKLKEHLKRYI